MRSLRKRDIKSVSMKLTVPYYSQYLDVTDPFWMIRACGACALKMVAEYHAISVPDLVALCEEAKARDGYHMENGWVHDYLVMKAKELGLDAYRKEGLEDVREIKQALDAGNPVIISVEKRVLEQRRFHLLVLVGYDGDTFYYHESESTSRDRGQYRSCDTKTFMEFFRGKAIFVTNS